MKGVKHYKKDGKEWKGKYVEGHPTAEGCINISEVLYDSFNR